MLMRRRKLWINLMGGTWMDERSWCNLLSMGLTLNRLKKEGLWKSSPRQRGPEAVARDQGIVMIIEIEIIEGEAEVVAEEGMTVTGIVRDLEIIATEAEAAV